MATIKDVFGEQFDLERKKIQQTNSYSKLKLEGNIKERVIQAIKGNPDKFKSSSPAVKYGIGESIHDILLIDTLEQIKRKEFSNGAISLNRGVKWGNKYVTVNGEPEILNPIHENESYFIIGFLKTKPNPNSPVYPFYTLHCAGVLTMDDLLEENSPNSLGESKEQI